MPLARPDKVGARLLQLVKQSREPAEAFSHAASLTLLRDWRTYRRPGAVRLSLGPAVHVLSLPSEVVVDYQLYAQGLVPELFLACAAYADYSYAYLPTAAMYAEGGYEPKAGMYTPAIEASLKRAIAKTLADLR
jgi:hypothetical protein